jgi:hypothetical protein
MMTIAMQRASPTMISPVRYSGRSGSSSQADDPVQYQRRDQQPAVAGDGVEPVVADLRQHRIHHDQQPERDRQRHPVHRDRVERLAQARDQPAADQPYGHRRDDPHR